MFGLIRPPAHLCFTCAYHLKHTLSQAHAYQALVFTRHLVENINWRQSIPRLWGLEKGSSLESWLSSQEVLFLTTLHKHWKRDPEKKEVPDSLFPL